MHKYLCHYCNELECETSTCPICGKRTDLVRTEIYYCDKCNALFLIAYVIYAEANAKK